jgi:transposase-like protein
MSVITQSPNILAALQEIARTAKTLDDITAIQQELFKQTLETCLKAELDNHLGYSKHSPKGYNSGNSRNGYSGKTLKTKEGELEIQTPRDRNGTFEPLLVPKKQTRLPNFSSQILTFYAKGMSTEEITQTLEELYDVGISRTLVSQVTEAVIDRVTEWQVRPLEAMFPILYLDCIVVKIRQDKRVINKAVYLALGVNMEGKKELLGMWISENEGAKFWLSVLTELKNRGMQDVLVACVDGLTGFPDAIATVFPKTQTQLCIVHLVRNSLRYVSWKDKKAVVADLKQIYQSVTEQEAALELEKFATRWDSQYPSISRSWREHWVNIIPFFEYPEAIRKVIYTTNAIESLNSVIRKAVDAHKLFPNDNAALKVIFLATEQAAKKWTMPIRDWKAAINQFMILFPDRVQV